MGLFSDSTDKKQDGYYGQPLGMAWYKFLIYFGLIAGAIINLIQSFSYISGGVYFVKTNGEVSAEQVYAYYGTGLQIVDVLYGFFLIALAILAFIVRHKLANYRPDSLKFVTIFYSVVVEVPFLYAVLVSAIAQQSVSAQAVISMVVGLVFLASNEKYFKKRAHLFVGKPVSQYSSIQVQPQVVAKSTVLEKTTIIFCSKCGTKLQENSAFCHKCGTKIDRAPLYNNYTNSTQTQAPNITTNNKINKTSIDDIAMQSMLVANETIGKLEGFSDVDGIKTMTLSIGYFYGFLERSLSKITSCSTARIIIDKSIANLEAATQGNPLLQNFGNKVRAIAAEATKNIDYSLKTSTEHPFMGAAALYLRDLYASDTIDVSKVIIAETNMQLLYIATTNLTKDIKIDW